MSQEWTGEHDFVNWKPGTTRAQKIKGLRLAQSPKYRDAVLEDALGSLTEHDLRNQLSATEALSAALKQRRIENRGSK